MQNPSHNDISGNRLKIADRTGLSATLGLRCRGPAAPERDRRGDVQEKCSQSKASIRLLDDGTVLAGNMTNLVLAAKFSVSVGTSAMPFGAFPRKRFCSPGGG